MKKYGITANLCKCNKCGSILINQNPQIGAIEYELTGNELEMQWTGGLIEFKETDNENIWVCPICMTNDYLVNL
jgi:rubrerythrin